MHESEIHGLLQRLSGLLIEKGWKMATAESCTGGWIAKVCTDIAGSSAWFERGFVTYSNAAKADMLGVEKQAIEHYGAVSREVAEQMASGACAHSQARVSLAVTGIAGPDGGSEDKPVGTVWFAWVDPENSVTSERCRFEGGREDVRWQSVLHALAGLVRQLEQSGRESKPG